MPAIEQPEHRDAADALPDRPGAPDLRPVLNALKRPELRADAMRLLSEAFDRRMLERIGGIVGRTRDMLTAATEQPEDARKKAVRELVERAEKDPAAFHREITLTAAGERAMSHADGAEEHGRHWMRVRLSPNTRPKPLVIVINGNNNPLTNARPRPAGQPMLPPNAAPGTRPSWATDPRGTPEERRTWSDFPQGINRSTTNVFDRIAANNGNDFDVIQLRVGDVFSADPRLSTDYAQQVARLVLRQALNGQGAFAGRQYTDVRIMGNSHGGGLTRVLSENWAEFQPAGRTVPLSRTVYYDAVQYGRSNALTQRPVGSGRHLNLFQSNRVGFPPVSGARTEGLRGGDENVEITRDEYPSITGPIDHRHINNAFNPGMADVHADAYRFLIEPSVALDIAQANRAVRRKGQFSATGR